MRFVLAAATVLLITGCADSALVSTTAPTVVASANGAPIDEKTKLVCHKETAIGTQIIHTVCEQEQTDAERQATQRRINDNRGSQVVAHPGIGGG